MSERKTIAIIIVLILGLSSLTHAAIISVNFTNFQDAGVILDSTDTAGVVPAANWTNIQDDVNVSNLVDETGTPTTVDFTQTNSNNYDTDVRHTGTGVNGEMLSGFVGYFNQNDGATFTFSEIDFPRFDLYIYWGSGRDNNSDNYEVTYEINDTQTGGIAWSSNTQFDGTFTRSLATDAADAQANYLNHEYLLFEGLTGTTLKIDILRNDNLRQGISGIQIFGIPEPATASLLGLAGLALLRRRRWA